MDGIGRLFGAIDAVFRGIRDGFSDGIRSLIDGPLQGVGFVLVLAVTGLVIVVERLAGLLDRVVGWLERLIVTVALLAMGLLAFNEYLQREYKPRFDTDLGGLWALEGQMNLALLLMVVVGFVGASLATQEGKHISVDAMDRVLSPGPLKYVKRFVALVAAGISYVLMNGTIDAVWKHSHDSFEGLKVWGFMVGPINWLTALLPADKYGPGTQYPDRFAWEDAMYAADPNISFDTMPAAFPMVEAGARFPLWLPLALIGFTFGVMALRFLAQVVSPKLPEPTPPKPGTRKPADVVVAGAFTGALIALGFGVYFGEGATILLASVLLVLLGSPLWIGVGVGTIACWVLLRDAPVTVVVSDMFEATKKQELLSIPFFVLAGNIMTSGSIATRLIAVARGMMGGIPGGLGAAAVIACAFFAAISGSSPVTVIAIGSIMFPMLIKEGYSERYSLGVLSTAGSLGIIIPPSIPMIVYAVMVNGSAFTDPATGEEAVINLDPVVLFKAGILPGLLIAAMLVAWTFYVNWPRAAAAPALKPALATGLTPTAVAEPDLSLGRTFVRAIPSLMLPVLILGGIYGLIDFTPVGIDFAIRFTVTEAAAVSVIYALFVELVIHREMRIRKLWDVCSESAIQMGSLFLILVIAISLNKFLVFQQAPEAATEFVMSYVSSKWTFLIAANIFLLILGCLMDIMSAIFIVAPLLAPIAAQYGIHPVHFGIMFIVNLEIGYLTPPMGINLFVSSTVFGRPVLEVIKAVVPFLVIMLVALAIIVWWPGLSLFLVE